MIDWIKATHGVVASVPAVFSRQWSPAAASATPCLVFSPEPTPIHRRIEAPEQFNRDTQRLVLDPDHRSAHPLGTLWPETGVAG